MNLQLPNHIENLLFYVGIEGTQVDQIDAFAEVYLKEINKIRQIGDKVWEVEVDIRQDSKHAELKKGVLKLEFEFL